MSTFLNKLFISLSSAGLFVSVNRPEAYKITGRIFKQGLYNITNGCPTFLGSIIHTIVFFVLTFFSMGRPDKETLIKVKHSVTSTLIYYLVSSPAVFSFVASILGSQYASSSGCPTFRGIMLHALVYCVALFGFMYFPEKDKIKQ